MEGGEGARDGRSFGFDEMVYQGGQSHSSLFRLSLPAEGCSYRQLTAMIRVAHNANKELLIEAAGKKLRLAFYKL